jgi:CheY-like chemotaxis protein/anti-sigma regulatory factor (Ser/Thr protein kinase)
VQDLLEEAKKASIRAKDLTQQLLTFAKGGAPVKQTACIDKIIVDSANFVLHGSSVICEYDFTDDLWSADVDTGQISQVIQNIIINGRHAMPEGGVIKVSCENSAVDPGALASDLRYIKITITDSGTGISAKHIDKIFDPYFSTKQTGSGLGLAICHSIITKHEGTIAVKSEAGGGTTFTILLPASQQAAATVSEVTRDTSITKEKYLIMVMDDDPMIRNLAQMMLNQLGHEVIIATNGNDAINLYNEHLSNGRQIGITIMDLTIPGGMGGQEAVQEILKINPAAKVIVSSGYSNDQVMAAYKDYGFAGSLAKPFQMDDLVEVIRTVSD